MHITTAVKPLLMCSKITQPQEGNTTVFTLVLLLRVSVDVYFEGIAGAESSTTILTGVVSYTRVYHLTVFKGGLVNKSLIAFVTRVPDR